MPPQILFITLGALLLWRRKAVIPEEKETRIRYQRVVVAKNVTPRSINGIIP